MSGKRQYDKGIPGKDIPFVAPSQIFDAADEAIKQHHSQIAKAFATIAGKATVTSFAPIVQIHEPLPTDNPVLALVGRIASDWARIEHILDVTIWKLAKLDPPLGACMTAQIMGARPRLLCIIALLTHLKFSERIVKLANTVMHESEAPNDLRNRTLHDPWYLEKTTQTPAQLRSMPRKELIYGYKPMPAKELNRTLAQIKSFDGHVYDLYDRIMKVLEPNSLELR